MDIYELVRGPIAWLALLVFVFGSLYRVVSILMVGKKQKQLYPSDSARNALRSILHGVLPFGSTYMRKQPVFTMITFIFHLCLITLPLFLLAHIVLWYESWEIMWWSLPDVWADIMAIFVILSCVYFFTRRFSIPEVKNVTRRSDYLFLIIVMLPFLTGFLAFHQWGPYRPILILHVLSGEILLITIPFSRLSHMLLFVFTRAYMGAEYGKVLNASEW
jgi:nitrate reductase gamma subunit